MSQKHANTASLGGDRARLGTFRYTLRRISRHWQLYLVLLIPVALLIIFSYGPMYGVQIAFKDFKVRQGIWGSKWVGMKHFNNFWGTHNFNRLITNTLTLSVYSLLAGFPIPILLALMLNDCGNLKFKKTVQMITYAPHFISTVVMCSIILLVLTSSKNGIINNVRQAFGAADRIDFITKPNYFALWLPGAVSVYNMVVARTFFQTNIPEELYEAGELDGCSDIMFMLRIALPLAVPIIAVLVMFYAVGHWNGYFGALIYLNDKAKYPLQIILRNILIENRMDDASMMVDVEAMARKQGLAELLKYSLIVIGSLPMLILYPFVQKHFVKGVMIGALKG